TGAVLTAVGIVGFFETGFDDFAHHHTGEELLGFEINPLHNVVHLVLGLLGLGLWTRARHALAYGLILAVGYGAALVYGLFAVDEDWDFLSLNGADNWLHLGLAALGAVIAAIAYAELRRRVDDRRRSYGGEDRYGDEDLGDASRVAGSRSATYSTSRTEQREAERRLR